MLRGSDSSIDLRLSSEDLLLPVAGTIKRKSISCLQDLSEEIFSLTPLSAKRKEDIKAQIDLDYPEYDYTASVDASDDDIRHLVKHFFPDDDISAITVCSCCFILSGYLLDRLKN